MWKEYGDIYSIILNKIIKDRNNNMEGITPFDIDNIVEKVLETLESKIIETEIMDGSGNTENIKMYYYTIIL